MLKLVYIFYEFFLLFANSSWHALWIKPGSMNNQDGDSIVIGARWVISELITIIILIDLYGA